MKLCLFAAFIAVVSSGPVSEQQSGHSDTWPWQEGKEYQYEVTTHTLAYFQEGPSSGNAFKTNFIVRVMAPGQLKAKVENPQYAQFHQHLKNKMEFPADLQYKSAEGLDFPFSISVEGGRVLSMSMPSIISVANENILKGLVSALQVDLSTHRHTHKSQNNYDKEVQQGLFTKFETDVTGDCETLYSVSPVTSEWKRELPQFLSDEDPMEVTKSRNYGHCHHRVAYHFGVPKGAEWTGTAHKNVEKQFISHGAVSRILVGKQGPIYKAETTSTVHVHPHIYGRQKAEVHSYVNLTLFSVADNIGPEWPEPRAQREVKSLLYGMSTKQVVYHDQSSSSSESVEFHERASKFPTSSAHYHHSHEDQYSQQSSSSSDSSMSSINDEVPKMNEPAYAAMYLNPQVRGDKKQTPMNAQKLLLDLAQQLQNPNNMPKAEFLSKFNILVREVSSMSLEQLSQTSRSIEVGKASNNIVKADMWMIFRDAVVASGTPPAFQLIKSWITSKKIENEEAAEVITTLASTLRYPTKDIMTQFFDFAVSPEVQAQSYLNSTAVIAAARFIRMGYVDHEMAKSYYPTLMYGHFIPKHDQFVNESIIPRLSQLLKQAVEKEEFGKAQVYIKAIGTLGHREILYVLAPYLEGKTPVPNYFRVQMVTQLKALADLKDRYARAVLYSILKNTGEPYAVRVAAALNMFRANPTTDMLRVMAQMTNDDPSIEVRAVLKSGIENAANLTDPKYWHLARSAQTVKDMVTDEDLGLYYSNALFYDTYDHTYDVSNGRSTKYIASEDSAIPKVQMFSWCNRFFGQGAENTIAFSVSSSRELINYIWQLVYEPRKSATEHEFSATKISQLLNLKQNKQEPLQSSVYFNVFDQQRFFALDEANLKELAHNVEEYIKQLESGSEKHYTKVFYAKQISVMFPIASGVPFIYKYKEPIVVHLQNKYSGKVDPAPKSNDVSMKMQNEVQFTFARNVDGSIGFIDTFSNQLASAGVVSKYQLSVPVKLSFEGKFGEYKIKLEPLNTDQDVNIFHHSVWPYSALQKKDSLTPVSQDPSTQLVERPKKVVSVDRKFGQQIGTAFQLQGYSYSKSYRRASHWLWAFNDFSELISEEDLAQTYVVFKYLGKQSKAKSVTVTAVVDEFYNQKQTGEFNEAAQFNDISPNSAARREEMMKRVASGINTATARVLDLGASFEGPQKVEYAFTVAYAESQVDPKVQAAVFYGTETPEHDNEQFNAAIKVITPKASPLNYQEALKNKITFTYEANVTYGQNSNINVTGHANRSQQYTDQLKNWPRSKECDQEIAQGNFFQPACYRTMVEVQSPDQFQATVTYKNLPLAHTAFVTQFYYYLQNQASGNVDYDPANKTEEGQIELQAQAYYADDSLNFEVTSPNGQVQFENIPIPDYTSAFLTAYRPFGMTNGFEHWANFETSHQYKPICTVDGKTISTFSDRGYDYQVSKAWHLLMHEQESKDKGQWNELVILAKKPAAKQMEVYISYKTETGKDFEVKIPSSAAKNKADVIVKTASNKVSDGDLTIYWDDYAEQPLLQYYVDPEGVLLLTIGDADVYALFDGERLILVTSQYRNTTRGICGHNSGDPRDDYWTPYGLVNEPQHFGASYALDAQSDPQTQQWKTEAQQQAYQFQPKYTTILRSDADWQKTTKEHPQEWGSQNVYRSRNYQKQRGQCQLQNQVQYHENHGEICITTTPLPTCQSHCHGSNYQVQQVQAICKPKSDQQFKTFKNEIHHGQNPEVTGVPKNEQYRVPTSCTV